MKRRNEGRKRSSLLLKKDGKGKETTDKKKMPGREIAEGSIGKYLFFPHFRATNERINAISRDFSSWMAYLHIKHKLEDCVWSLRILNFTLFTYLLF